MPDMANLPKTRAKLARAKKLILSGATVQDAAEQVGLSRGTIDPVAHAEGWHLQRATAQELALAESIDWRDERAVYRCQSYAAAKALLEAVETIGNVRDRVESWRVVNREIRAILGMDSDGAGGGVQIAVFTAQPGKT